MKKLSLLEKLQDNNYALYFAIVTCFALAPNSYFMFYTFSIIPKDFFAREIQAGVVALIISGSILYYTAKKNLEYANRFAYFEFFISCCYYFQSLIMTDAETHTEYDPHWNWHIIPAIAFAYMLPWSVKGYAASIDYGKIPSATIPPNSMIDEIKTNQEPFFENTDTRKSVKISDLPELKMPTESEKVEPEKLSTEEIIQAIERDEMEEIFNKGSISAIE